MFALHWPPTATGWVGAGTIIGREKALTLHGFYPWLTEGGLQIFTDDPAEAEAAWVRAEHFARTGMLA